MSEPSLTDAEREALGAGGWHTLAELHAAVERIVAARVADAVDRERAAWATKVGELADRYAGWSTVGTSYPPALVDQLRGLLADRRWFAVSAEEYDRIQEELSQPPKVLPRLAELLARHRQRTQRYVRSKR